MNLTTRVSIFFLAALGVALSIYSIAFYSVARDHIHTQFQEDLRGTLNSLIAAAEVEDTEVKWQPLEHSIDIAGHDEYGAIQWIVIGDLNQIIERSRVLDKKFQGMIDRTTQGAASTRQGGDESFSIPGWTVLHQHLFAPHPDRLAREFDEFDQLTIVVGRPKLMRDAILRRLLWLVTILPLLGWGIAMILGRWFIRQALRPVREMADQASSISGKDFNSRLSFHNRNDELADLGIAFNRLLDRQQDSYEQQRRFAGNAAHELRTPLTILLGQIDVTLRRPRTDDEYRKTLGILKSETESLQEIVESLLFLARSSEDGSPPPLRPVELKHWLREQFSTWQSGPRGSDLQLVLSIADDLRVLATPSLLSRVMDNLVFNAMKYSPPHSPIRIEVTSDTPNVRLRVIDEGFGIPASDIPSLFDPFFRASDARRRGIAGNGLGLAIAHRIALLLGGTLRCESIEGKGSTFTLSLATLPSAIH